MNSKNDKFLDQIRQQLDQSIETLDPATSSRLTQARTSAVASGARRKYRFFYWGALPAAGLALLLLLVTRPGQVSHPLPLPELKTLSILTAAESLDFYQEELEFYEWLSETMDLEKEPSDQRRTVTEPVATERTASAGTARRSPAQPGNA